MDGAAWIDSLPGGLLLPVAAVSAILGAWMLWRLQLRLRRWRLARMRQLGKDGERTARDLLAAGGFRILEGQATRTATMLVDGLEVAYEVRADYLVLRDGRRWVAEVKAGSVVCDPVQRETRRQLLEYRRVYADTAGVLLVDVPGRRIREIGFPDPSPASRSADWRLLLGVAVAGALLGAVATWLLRQGP